MDLKFWLCAVFLCLMASGCSTNEMIIKKQTEMEARFEQLIQGNAATNARHAEMVNELKELQTEAKANATELAQLESDVRKLKASVEVAAQRFDGKVLPPAAAKIVVVNKGALSSDRESVEQDAYMKAFGLFSTNNYSDAIASFESFITAYADSEYAGNAQYWIGECYYTQHDFTKAIEAFTRVVDNYPKGKKVPDALLKVGYSLINLNQPDKARVALEALVEKYPKTPAADKARERLIRR
jgi:tol-pal system protein YbgF